MIEKLKSWIKEHPRLAIALGLGILILIWLYVRRAAAPAAAQTSAGGFSSSDAVALQTAELQASTQLQAQNNSLTAQQNTLAAQLQAKNLDEQAQLSIAQLQQNTALENIYASKDVALAQTAGAVQIAQINAGASEAGVQAQQNVDIAQIQAQQQTNTGLIGLAQLLAGGGALPVPINAPIPSGSVVSSGRPITPAPVTRLHPRDISPTALSPAPNTMPSQFTSVESQIAADAILGAQYAQSGSQPSFPGANPYYQQEQLLSNQPGVTHTYPDVVAAIAAGAVRMDPATGRYITTVPGAQVTY